ncbi:MAG: ricin-type beta-trefoil lectin domain protein [Actinobacteria bacterium]|nr:ricin-type beta-trefoil lectin domain protein [Actinomycetota bacterium]
MRRNTVCLTGLALALTLSVTLLGASSAGAVPEGAARSDARALTDNAVYVIEADSRSREGSYLRVGVYENVVQAPAVLQPPITALALRSLRHRQYWRAVKVADTFGGTPIYQFRNLYSDMCLTVARPEHSPVYLQRCGSWKVRGQLWSHLIPGILASRNTAGASYSMCLDITEFRNAKGTRLQVGRCHEKWNQLWRFKRVSENYAK